MSKRIVPILAICLVASTPAHAQFGGGGGRGHGNRGGQPPSSSSPAPTATPAATPPLTPLDKIEIVGVVTKIGPEPDRIVIAYDAVDALNWPRGTMPFVVAKPDLLKGATVGEKVRFKLQSEQISELKPY
jgi:Cu/Ag efflux protein CusF